MRTIDADALKEEYGLGSVCEACAQNTRACQFDQVFTRMDICQMIDDAPTVGGWVSVKDRLPEVGVTCLVAFADEGMTFSSLDASGKWYVVNGLPQPDYWMPLPEPPGRCDE